MALTWLIADRLTHSRWWREHCEDDNDDNNEEEIDEDSDDNREA